MILANGSIRLGALALATLVGLYGSPSQAAPADAASAAAPGAPEKDKDKKPVEAVTVVAVGETRQIQKVSAADMATMAPGSSPLKAIDKLPGVYYQSADPWGVYEWPAQLSLHGFDQSRLGFTLDGIPLGGMIYEVTNGLFISRAVTTENLDRVELSQGAGSLGTASNSNLGGTIQFFTSDPEMDPGVRLDQVLASDATHRSYVRLDTGDHGGFSAYLSYVHADAGKWKGYGKQKEDQVNLKALFLWGQGNSISLFADSSRRREYDYMDMSLTSTRALGWDWDYLQPDWNLSEQIADAYWNSGQYGGLANGYPSQLGALPADYDWLDAVYYAGGGIRDDDLVGLSASFAVGATGTLNVAGYNHSNRGEGQWTTPYTRTSATVPIAMRTTDYGLDRHGGTFSYRFSLGRHDIEFGGWGEDASNNQERNFFPLTGQYTQLTSFYHRQAPVARVFFQNYDIRTRMVYAQDTMHLWDDRLTLNFGAKSLDVDTTATQRVPNASLAQGKISASKGFLPQVGVNFKVDQRQELYASYSKNLAAFTALPFTQSQASFDNSKRSLEPEQSQTFQLGYRIHDGSVSASLDGYVTRFDNRLLAVSPCSIIQTCSAEVNNVGSVRSEGVDFAVAWKASGHLDWLNTVSYDNSKYLDDYLNHGVVPTKGKYVTGIPSWMFTSALNYHAGPWKMTFDAKYTGRRYITYVNDSQVPAYWLFNAGANYDVGAVAVFEDLSLGVNVLNLLDKHYFCCTDTNGYVQSDPLGYNQTLSIGAPRSVFFNLNAKF